MTQVQAAGESKSESHVAFTNGSFSGGIGNPLSYRWKSRIGVLQSSVHLKNLCSIYCFPHWEDADLVPLCQAPSGNCLSTTLSHYLRRPHCAQCTARLGHCKARRVLRADGLLHFMNTMRRGRRERESGIPAQHPEEYAAQCHIASAVSSALAARAESLR